MEWNQLTVGLLITLLGLMAFMASVDFATAVPGNILFFSGIITMTWGSANPAAQGFFNLASMSLIFVTVAAGWSIYKVMKRTPGSQDSP